MSDVLLLNFDNEEDGATEWLEEAQGLSPDESEWCEVDATTSYEGSGCLICHWDYFASPHFIYSFSGLEAIFTYKIRFRIDSPNHPDIYAQQLALLWDDDGFASISVVYGYDSWEGEYQLAVEGMDREENFFEPIMKSYSSLLSDWNLFKIAVSSTQATFYLNDSVVGFWLLGDEYSISDPFLGIDHLYVGRA